MSASQLPPRPAGASVERNATMLHREIEGILDAMEAHLLGKRKQLEYSLTCLLAEGHLLIEDVPGVGKTTLAKSLASIVAAEFNRVQFTSDLLPSDLIGVTVFHQASGRFEFQPGPIFTNVLLADEINRANPKTQSALLEAMHDSQISHDGQTKPLPRPFFVVATQNSKDHHGTFPLPESQLDRFLMKISLGYPTAAMEKRVMEGDYLQDFAREPCVEMERLLALQEAAKRIFVAPEILDYMYRLVAATRSFPATRIGVSPRGGQALFRGCQALAMVRGRDFVIPDDILELAPLICTHRMVLKPSGGGEGERSKTVLLREILTTVAAPQ